MELRHLRYFVAVAEEGHVTRASERLGIQQPPLSQQIHALENELELQLFRRKPRGVELTDAGKVFLEDARNILERVDEAQAKAHRTARGELGRIVVGFTSSAPLNPFVPGAIRSFQENYPKISIVLEEDGTGALVDGVRSETVDVAFIRSRFSDTEGLTVYPVVEEPMVAAIPTQNQLSKFGIGRGAKPLSLRALAGEKFILYRRRAGPGLHDAIIAACQKAGFSPIISQEAPQIVSSLNLVAAGLGISIVPASLRNLKLPGIVFVDLATKPQVKAPINLLCRKTEHSAVARNFVQLVRKLARD